MRRSLLAVLRAAMVLVALLHGAWGLAASNIQVTSARVWPAQDYARVTLESREPVQHKFLSLKDPERLVLDLEGVAITDPLSALIDNVGANDPYIKGEPAARRVLGASITFTDRQHRDEILQQVCDDARSQGHRPYLVPYGGSNATGALGYAFAVQELLGQVSDADWIVFPTSSGGTQAGLVAGARVFGCTARARNQCGRTRISHPGRRCWPGVRGRQPARKRGTLHRRADHGQR